MKVNWKRYQVANLIVERKLFIGDGYRAKNEELSPAGLPFARAGNIDGGFDFGDADRFPQENLSRVGNKVSQPGDVVFTSKGTVGRFAFVRENMPRFVYSPQLCFWRSLNPLTIHPRFLYYWMRGREFFLQYKGVAGQTDMAEYVSLSDQRRMYITLPPIDQQRAIAQVLGTLDDKIELNRQMNETLEAMARAIFKSWFVDATQAGLPKGWHEGKVEELLTLSRETINPSDFPDETFDHYSIPSFDDGRLPKVETGEQIQSNKFLVPPGAVMISKLNPRIPRVWLPNVSAKYRSAASTEFLVAIPKPGISREWVYALFSSEAFLDVFATLVTGTSGSHQRVKPEYLLAMDLEIPPKERIAEYTAVTKPLHARFALNLEESRTLAALRDTLLPKLISGELRVKDPAPFLGGVVP